MYMKINGLESKTRRLVAVGYIVLTLCAGASPALAQAPANVSPDLQQVVKLAQAQMSDDVIISFIKNSGKSYNLSSDDILYLNSQHVSQPVISALLQAKGSDMSAPPPTAAPTPPPSTPPPVQPETAPPPIAPPSMAPPPMAAPPIAPSGLFDTFANEPSLNPALWTVQSDVLRSLAAFNTAAPIMPMLAFGPGGMQMSGINGPGQFMGVASVTPYFAPFTF